MVILFVYRYMLLYCYITHVSAYTYGYTWKCTYVYISAYICAVLIICSCLGYVYTIVVDMLTWLCCCVSDVYGVVVSCYIYVSMVVCLYMLIYRYGCV